ncbi:GcvT family protein [Planobispora longispora]|uniref:Sarcosine dehydrogenase n=1 Tax=Planobispora longispora TaxID=28887 RepID=A0A8J3RQ41_9ACTN|nr:FAD-dependent oxidoreductase [Planobispora longispora]GIH77619.1 sarcosine dehydrogenase [Planobispora longispora]
MAGRPRVVIIGAGIVGCALADELTVRGWTDVTVLEQGPLFAAGGSSSHAPGLVFQTNPSKTMTDFAVYTVAKYRDLSLDGKPCFTQVGGLEVATTPERWRDLHRRHGWAASWGVESELVDPARCAALWPPLDASLVHGGFHIPSDGLADAVRCGEAQARRAIERGARFLAGHRVVAVDQRGGRVTGVTAEVLTGGPAAGSRGPGRVPAVTGSPAGGEVLERVTLPADLVVCAAGFWGPRIGELAGLTVPLLPLAHQYARSGPLPVLAAGRRAVRSSDGERGGAGAGGEGGAEAVLPILRHQDRDLYFRQHGDRIGVGSYSHRPMPVRQEEIPLRATTMPSVQEFTPGDYDPAWRDAAELVPALGGSKPEEGVNGIFSFTPDGFPLIGEAPELAGFWVAEAVWVTHSAGVARALAEWLVDGHSAFDLHECELSRFEPVQLAPAYVAERGGQNFVEVYDVVHPLQPMDSPRPLRTSPFHPRQRELGAFFLEAAGWERPHWFEANAALLEDPVRLAPDAEAFVGAAARDEWAARYWSPIAAAEAWATRQRVALYDMTPLKRIEVTGPGAAAFLRRMTTGAVDKPPGAVTYTLLLDPGGGIRSDLTVARLGEERFQVGANGNLDLAWLRRHAPPDGVGVRDVTPGTCCVGVWGPRARDLVQPLTDLDLSNEGFRYFTVKSGYVGQVPVTMMRLSYVGELGWEIYTTADLGLRLWDLLWEAGRRHGVAAGGRAAFNSLRLEKGYRLWGVDMTPEHRPEEAGLGWAVRMGKSGDDGDDFVGRQALEALRARGGEVTRRLVPLLTERVVMGGEPVFHDGRAAGYVTSAAYGHTLGRAIAYAWLPAAAAAPGTAVEVEYFGERVPARVAAEPLFDPAMSRIKR